MKLLDNSSHCYRSSETLRGLIDIAPNKSLIIEIETVSSHTPSCFVELLCDE